MPHDCSGKLLQVGDEVVFRGSIEQIDAVEDYCNVRVKTVHPAKPLADSNAMSTFYFNAAQLEKVERVEKVVPPTLPSEPPPEWEKTS